MIISAVLGVVLSLYTALLNTLPALPSLPADVSSIMDELIVLMGQGINLMANFINMPLALTLAGLSLLLHKFREAWNILFWFLRKIPFLGIK